MEEFNIRSLRLASRVYYLKSKHSHVQVLEKRVSLYDYELIAGENKERLVAFGEYAGRAGMIDFLRGLGERKIFRQEIADMCRSYSSIFEYFLLITTIYS